MPIILQITGQPARGRAGTRRTPSGAFAALAWWAILKCHVLVGLKLEALSRENIGQSNTYICWYGQNMKSEVDNPPVGILLCTKLDGSQLTG
jgi:hypothetical protein